MIKGKYKISLYTYFPPKKLGKYQRSLRSEDVGTHVYN